MHILTKTEISLLFLMHACAQNNHMYTLYMKYTLTSLTVN